MEKNSILLILNTKWYKMIESGEKREEYRDATDYWEKRIWNKKNELKFIVFQFGYEKEKRMRFEIEGVFIFIARRYKSKNFTLREGMTLQTEWGFDPSKDTYIIRLGKRIGAGDKC